MTSGNSRHRYNENFKRQAVQKCITSGKPVAHIAASLGIDRTNLQKWKKKYGCEFMRIAETPLNEKMNSNEFLSLKKEFESIKETVVQLRNIVQKSLVSRYSSEQ